MRVYLLRHGETAYNEGEERFCGAADVPLSQYGVGQAREASHIFKDVRLDGVYDSGMLRAKQTAVELVARQPHLKASDIRHLSCFREVSFGVWEGLTRDGVARVHPELYRRWLEDPTTEIPGADNFETRRSEVLQGFMNLVRESKFLEIAIVAHSTLNRLLLTGLLGMEARHYRRLKQGNLCVNTIEADTRGNIQVCSVNAQRMR